MHTYVESIKLYESERNKLHQELHAAFLLRDRSALKRRDWEIAAKRFRDHRSTIDAMMEHCYRCTSASITPEIRHFMFDYIRADPQFFRSGYLMERILQRIKRLPMSNEEKRAIQHLLLFRTKVKAMRNFRQICRLIPRIQDEPLRSEIADLMQSQDASIRHRAAFAITYFSQ